MTTITLIVEIDDDTLEEDREALCQGLLRQADLWEAGMGYTEDNDIIKVTLHVTEEVEK